MPVKRISSVYRANNQYKGFNSYFVGKKKKSFKITELPINKPKVKRSVWGKPMDYIKILIALAVIGLLNGLIGG
jgi:hypothetical protein